MSNPYENFRPESPEPEPGSGTEEVSLTGTSLIAQAMALQESGILIHGMEVTDLSTGYVVQAPPHAQAPGYLEFTPGGQDYPYRASGLSMARLEELHALVRDVADQRESNKVWASVNPPTPRRTFPWGLGLDKPDVLLTDGSQHSKDIQAFLRQRGFRARIVDPTSALRIFAELNSTPAPESEPWEPDDLRSGNSKRLAVVASAVIALVVLAIGAWKVLPGEVSVEASPATTASTPPTTTRTSPPQSTSVTTPTAPPTFQEHRKADEVGMAPAAERALIPVAIDVPGWRRIGASEGREEFMADDPDMRILVAAKPTPLDTQELLDQAVLTAVESAGGTSELEITGTSPAAYRERIDGSETRWTVRLVAGHQMSIGCQVRSTPANEHRIQQRQDACGRAIETARLD